jgi:hypothetical protein
MPRYNLLISWELTDLKGPGVHSAEDTREAKGGQPLVDRTAR